MPHLGGLPEIFVFYFSRCKQAETREQAVCRSPIGVVVGNKKGKPRLFGKCEGLGAALPGTPPGIKQGNAGMPRALGQPYLHCQHSG